jgi:serine-type D-Ala-D-Ala carboxypeptidase/endopeptidase
MKISHFPSPRAVLRFSQASRASRNWPLCRQFHNFEHLQRPKRMKSAAFVRLARAIALLIVLGAARSSAQTWPGDSAVRAILQERVQSKRSVGIVLATLEKGKSPVIVAAGTSGSSAPLDGNSVFEIGSVSKVFTTALLADMVRRGEVSLDDPIAKYLPSTVRVPSRGGKQITLFDLATQSSGLPRLPTNLKPASMANPYADYTVQQMYDFLSGYELPRDIGSKFEYSNFGMGLLGHVLALRAHKTYDALLTERILQPLGMRDTRIVLTPAMQSRLATGHDGSGNPVANWDIPTLAGAGAIRSTANDMAKFLAANLDSTAGQVAMALAHAHGPFRDAGTPAMRVGLAWLTLTAFGAPIIWHNGETGGYHSFVGFDPANARGVVVLSNSNNSIDDIGLHILNPAVPLVPTPKARAEIAINPSLLDAYVGSYALAPTFSMAITREGNALFAQATGQPKFQIYPETETDFFYKVVDAQLTFVKDATGKVNQIILHQNGANIPGKRAQ